MPSSYNKWDSSPTLELVEVTQVCGVKRDHAALTGYCETEAAASFNEKVRCKRLCQRSGVEQQNNWQHERQDLQYKPLAVWRDECPPADLTVMADELNELPMNINVDDCYDESYQTACDAMEGEGAADKSHYSAPIRQHEAFCFGPETSPNSGISRCYCRPSWDGLIDSKTFFSDIY